MFDLFRSREKAVRYLLTVLLGLVALSMVAYLIPGYGTGGQQEEQVIAEIGGERLTLREVQLNLQAAMRDKRFPMEIIQQYIPQYVNQMITERALAYQAGRLGFEVTEDDLAASIQSMLPNLFPGGQFNKEAYQMFLAQQNLTIPEFEANVRKQMLLIRMQNLVLQGVVVTPDEVEKEFRRRNEKAKLEYVSFSPDKFRTQVQVSPEEIKASFEKNRGLHSIPEKRSFDLLVIDEEKVGAQLTTADSELIRLYNQNKDRYRLQERVKARHILVATTGKTKDEETKLEAKANDLLKQVKAGKDFAELAKKNSDDPGSGSKGGDLDWVSRGQMVKNFEDTAFSLKPGETSGVIKTEYGFHIVQVMEKEGARLKPFEEVKGELAQEYKRAALYDRMQTLGDQARALLAKSPQDAAKIAQQLGIIHHAIEKAGMGDPIQDVGVSPDFESAISSLAKGGVTPVVSVPGNKLAVAVMKEIFPARPAELSEVESAIRGQLTAEKARETAQKKAAEAEAKLKSLGGDLKKLGGEVKTSPEFARDGAVEGLGSATYFEAAFTSPVGTVLKPVTVSDLAVIAKVAARIDADMSKLPAEREGLISNLKSQKARQRRELFEDGLIAQLIREGKVKINQDAIRRLVSSYRS